MRIKFLSFLSIVISGELTLAQYSSKLIQLDSLKFMLTVTRYIQPNDSLILHKRLPYKVFKLIQADINNDGHDEFITGVIKTTSLDPVKRKRINIWKIENNNIVPLWLGSRMPLPLDDFEVRKLQDKFRVFTIEFESNGLFLVAEYEWHSFGLKFLRYIKREILHEEALSLIKNTL